MRFKIGIMTVLLCFIAGCDGLTGPGHGGKVAIRFGTSAASNLSANVMSASNSTIAADQLTVTGTNGTLVIDDIRFIVSKMELESSDNNNSCREDDEGDDGEKPDDDETENDDDCEFEGGPFIVDLPLDGNVSITTQNVAAGTYDRLKLKIDDLEGDDDDDAAEKQRIPEVLNEMRTVYPNFPSRATMVVRGTQNGQPFTVYFKADGELEQQINPPITVPKDNAVTVQLNPADWFKNGNQIVNLLALNGRLVEFGSAFSGGFKGAHGDDD